ncbi:hypothetical protein [Nonomuraea sp. bgisy101]|uniref:DUF4190 domain-containing protein n=1 Tax=Nonomuraea sp. bgisy101 TaxID=3413784 RepID=UPI003D713811
MPEPPSVPVQPDVPEPPATPEPGHPDLPSAPEVPSPSQGRQSPAGGDADADRTQVFTEWGRPEPGYQVPGSTPTYPGWAEDDQTREMTPPSGPSRYDPPTPSTPPYGQPAYPDSADTNPSHLSGASPYEGGPKEYPRDLPGLGGAAAGAFAAGGRGEPDPSTPGVSPSSPYGGAPGTGTTPYSTSREQTPPSGSLYGAGRQGGGAYGGPQQGASPYGGPRTGGSPQGGLPGQGAGLGGAETPGGGPYGTGAFAGESPGTPGTPERPGTPGMPGSPGASGVPGAPGSGGHEGGTPGAPGGGPYGGVPGSPYGGGQGSGPYGSGAQGTTPEGTAPGAFETPPPYAAPAGGAVYAPPPGGAAPYQGAGWRPAKPGNGLATASLVLGIASLFLLLVCFTGVITALVGLVLGVIALSKGGSKGRAWVGIGLSVLTLVLAVGAAIWVSNYFAECSGLPQQLAEQCVESKIPWLNRN